MFATANSVRNNRRAALLAVVLPLVRRNVVVMNVPCTRPTLGHAGHNNAPCNIDRIDNTLRSRPMSTSRHRLTVTRNHELTVATATLSRTGFNHWTTLVCY